MRQLKLGSGTLGLLAISVGFLFPGVVRAQGSTRPERRHPESPSTYGTSRTSLYRVGPMEFQPVASNVSFFPLFGPGFGRYAEGQLFAVPHLPSGALLKGVELDFCDFNLDHHVELAVFSASFNGTGSTPLGSVLSSNLGCSDVFLDLTSQNFTLDNNANELLLRAAFGAVDATNAITGVIVHYQLQVSPPPATATFADVPTSHPFFRVIEALAKAGITSGCGGGNFCPDQTVTRGELAKFFAVALGLQFE
jgi:hypothetical protein